MAIVLSSYYVHVSLVFTKISVNDLHRAAGHCVYKRFVRYRGNLPNELERIYMELKGATEFIVSRHEKKLLLESNAVIGRRIRWRETEEAQ